VGQIISVWLCMSPCRSDYIFTVLFDGVRRIVSEDSGCVRPVYSPVPTASIHGERIGNQRSEARFSEVLLPPHRRNDAGKGEEVTLFRAHERLRLEEWDDPRQEVFPTANYQHQRGVRARSMVLTNLTTAEATGDEVEDLAPFAVLAHSELRYQFPTGPGACVPTDRYVKRTFSIDETRDIRIQPFLLIVRTGWIFTAHAPTLRRG
jgi:hypothetical protein